MRCRESSDDDCLDPVDPIDVCLGVYRPKGGSACLVAHGKRARHRRVAGLVRRSTQDVIEYQGTDTAVDVSGRSFVGGSEGDVGPHTPI